LKLNKIIRDLSKEDEDIGIQVQPPASNKDINKCQKELAQKGFPSIPDEYVQFLRICNGFLWGLSFLGTKPFHSYSDYTYHDLVAANEDFIKYYKNFAQYLLIGEGHEKKFLYEPEKNLYRTWDYDAGLWDDYETFEAMFLYENELVEEDE